MLNTPLFDGIIHEFGIYNGNNNKIFHYKGDRITTSSPIFIESGNSSNLLQLVNNNSLAANVKNSLWFRTGSFFTGAIKTIGKNSNESRMGLFTGSTPFDDDLLERVTILNNGNVGIGIETPNNILDVNGRIRIRHNGSTSGLWFSNSANSLSDADGAFYGMKNNTESGIYIGNAWRFWVTNTGNATLLGTLTQSSDKRLKKDFLPLNNSLSDISNLNGYHYKWIEESRSKDLQTGLIAQEVQKIFPELVQTDEKGFLSVNYIGLVPHLIEAVKELRDENSALKINNQQIKTQNQTLASRLDKIEAMLTTIHPNT